MSAAEGYKLSKSVSLKVTHLLYIDDLKIFAASENKLVKVIRTVKDGKECIGLKWNEKRYAVAHVKRGCLDRSIESVKIGDLKPINSLGEDNTYKFLGVLENIKQEDKLVLESAAKAYLQRLSIIWSSPLSDLFKFLASNQYALPLLSYLMWTQTWPLADLQQLDREARKIILENGGNHPQGSTAILYLPRRCGGRGMRSVEKEYKNIKVKAAVKLYRNPDPSMGAVRGFEEKAVQTGRHSIIKDAEKYAQELGLQLYLNYPNPMCITEDGQQVRGEKVKTSLTKAQQQEARAIVEGRKWHGKLMKSRWDDKDLSTPTGGRMCPHIQ